MGKRLKRGYSLLEVVIAMGLIVMLSVVGFLSCTVAVRISAGSAREVKAYADCEKLHLSADDAYLSIEGDPDRKEEYLKSFFKQLEWYFECDGIAERALSRGVEAEWAECFSLKVNENRETVRGISLQNFGRNENGLCFSCQIIVFGEGYSSQCDLNCRSETFSVMLRAYKSEKAILSYEYIY